MLILAGPNEEGDEGQGPEGNVKHDEHANVKGYIALLESKALNNLRSILVWWQWREVSPSRPIHVVTAKCKEIKQHKTRIKMHLTSNDQMFQCIHQSHRYPLRPSIG